MFKVLKAIRTTDDKRYRVTEWRLFGVTIFFHQEKIEEKPKEVPATSVVPVEVPK